MDLDPLEVTGVGRRACLDDSQGAVGECHCGDRHVLDGDPLVCQSRCPRTHFGDRAHEPRQEVDTVDRLIHQCTATVELPRPAPGTTVVILLRAVPLDVGVATGQGPKTVAIDGPLHLEARSVEPGRKDRGKLDVVPTTLGDDPVASAERDLERLLDHHMLAGPCCGHGRVHVGAAGRGDRDNVDGRIGEHVGKPVIAAALLLGRKPIGRLRHGVVAGDELRPAEIGDRPCVEIRNHSTTDNSKAKRHCTLPQSRVFNNSRHVGPTLAQQAPEAPFRFAYSDNSLEPADDADYSASHRVVPGLARARGVVPAVPMAQQSGSMPYQPRLHIVLYQPEIPFNAGSVGRTCVAVGAKLWLVRPLGFHIENRHLRRAGLDYWQHLNWEVVDDWNALRRRIPAPHAWYLTRTATRCYTQVAFQPGDALVFGCESQGLPRSMLDQYRDRTLRIPIRGEVRSLNLSNSVAVVAFEAQRQWEASADADDLTDWAWRGNIRLQHYRSPRSFRWRWQTGKGTRGAGAARRIGQD